MTDMQAAPVQGTAPLSTSIDQGGAPIGGTGGGAVPLVPDAKVEAPAKPEQAGDVLRGELARIRDEEAKEAAKVKGEGEEAAKDAKAKLEEAEKNPKPAKDDEADKAKPDAKAKTDEPAVKAEKSDAEKLAAGQEGVEKQRQSEGQKRNDPPARFLPKAKEAWVNVPHSVRDDVYRMEQEHEAEKAQTKQVVERYEPIRQFDEIAQKNGRELKDSLAKVVQVENALARNPVMGLDMILREIGPRKADGSALSLYEVAQHIARMTPEQFQQSMRGAQGQHQQAQAHQQTQTEVQQLRSELQNMRTETAAQTIIAPFAASHPRYQELEEDIAFFLKSGKVPASLSPVERLEAAYDMAERINPASKSSALQATDAPVAAKAAPADDAGAKSIRGAPNGGRDPDDDGDDETDIRKLLQREARKLAS